jgi:hypothetical protein
MAKTSKNNRELRAIAVLAILFAAGPQGAAAQDPGKLTVDVNDCLALEKRDERLACFDAKAEAARQRTTPQRAEPEPAKPERAEPARAAAAETRETSRKANSNDDFGRKEPAPQSQREIVAKVVELRERVPNAYMITLDNGQVWRQSQPMRYPLREGLEVRLRETKFGYRLTAPELRGQIPVERVR